MLATRRQKANPYQSMCCPTETPKGYIVGPLRDQLRKWIEHGKTKGMKMRHFIQVDSASGHGDCQSRADKWIPENWNVNREYIKGGVPEHERATGRFSKTDFKNRDMVYALETNVGFAGASCSRFKTGMH